MRSAGVIPPKHRGSAARAASESRLSFSKEVWSKVHIFADSECAAPAPRVHQSTSYRLHADKGHGKASFAQPWRHCVSAPANAVGQGGLDDTLRTSALAGSSTQADHVQMLNTSHVRHSRHTFGKSSTGQVLRHGIGFASVDRIANRPLNAHRRVLAPLSASDHNVSVSDLNRTRSTRRGSKPKHARRNAQLPPIGDRQRGSSDSSLLPAVSAPSGRGRSHSRSRSHGRR